MLVDDFDFLLPPELIAQDAVARGASRLLVLDRTTGGRVHGTIADLPHHLRPGDLLVVNDSRVFAARLLGRRVPTGGAVECLLLGAAEARSDIRKPEGSGELWSALVHPGQKLKPGARMIFDDAVRAPGISIEGEILERRFFGRRVVRFDVQGADSLDAAVDALGHIPLPPYIARPDEPVDRDRYQTVFADARGSVAAPTAELHFDAALIDALKARGVSWTTITLHVGYGHVQTDPC